MTKAKKQKQKKIHRDYGNVFKKCHERKKKNLLQRGRRERKKYAKIQEVKNVTFIMHRSIMRDQVLVIKTNGRMLGNLKGRRYTGCGLEWEIWRRGQTHIGSRYI